MLKHSGIDLDLDAAPQVSSAGFDAIDALYARETQANIVALREERRRKRQQKSMIRLLEYWPVAVGVGLSFFAPMLYDMVTPFRPWGIWLAFPFVAISGRPEIYMGDHMAVILPKLMVYIQFPLEGLLAKIALKGNVTVHGVLVQVAFFHGLCIIDLWLLSGGLWQLLHLVGH